jgi:hypothetical protein
LIVFKPSHLGRGFPPFPPIPQNPKPVYKEQTVTLTVNDGEMTELKKSLVKA